MENISLGIIAHVDAGKTTLSESLLHLSGAIRTKGRVDHGDAFLDTFSLEKQRGITIYTKQAGFVLGDKRFYLIDTPGHSDFVSEMERALYVLDYCILIINASESVTAKVEELWNMLRIRRVPCIIFVNKMDQEANDKEKILEDIHEKLGAHCVAVKDPARGLTAEEAENIAVLDEGLMEKYLDGTSLSPSDIAALLAQRKLFPVFFGSALKEEGVKELINSLPLLTRSKQFPDTFGARVFKISRDKNNARLTWLKITGGILKSKQVLSFLAKAKTNADEDSNDEEVFTEEKVDQIRIYSGEKYEAVTEAKAGVVCAITGPKETFIGMGLGFESGQLQELENPVLSYRVVLEDGEDSFRAYRLLNVLEEEDPLLNFSYVEKSSEISLRLMGQVQMETLQVVAKERFGLTIDFADPKVIYKETIKNSVIGLGHFEPLRHYAEVILKIEERENGSGIVVESDCSTDVLKANWQNLILSTLKRRRHKGVLTGSELTDVKITLKHGAGHEKHTSSGDFQKATTRALRQGLMQAESILLEPVYDFQLRLPAEFLGKAMTDISNLGGKLAAPRLDEELAYLEGSIPAARLGNYARDLQANTRGEAKISFVFKGYFPCEESTAEEVIHAYGYSPENDLANTPDSVFCAAGSGYTVPWNEMEDAIHSQEVYRAILLAEEGKNSQEDLASNWHLYSASSKKGSSREEGIDAKERSRRIAAEEKDLMQIFENTYGQLKEKRGAQGLKQRREHAAESRDLSEKEKAALAEKLKIRRKEYLLVDGYNVMHQNEQLKALANENIDAARTLLIDLLMNYQGYRREKVILVFDAYKVKGGTEHIEDYAGLSVVYTKHAETADRYIEKVAKEKVQKNAKVVVASSDANEQVVVFGAGALRMSAREFWLHLESVNAEIRKKLSELEKR